MAERRVEEVKKELELVHETMERQDDGTNYDNKPGIVGGFIAFNCYFRLNTRMKKVTVVSWQEEKDAGGRASSREKHRLGLAFKEKLPAPFRVILFQKNLKKKKNCNGR
jgi:hypothetical protein